MAQLTCLRQSWFSSVALVSQQKSSILEQLSQWKVYRVGLRQCWRMLEDVGPLLPPPESPLCEQHQLPCCTDNQVSLNGPHDGQHHLSLSSMNKRFKTFFCISGLVIKNMKQNVSRFLGRAWKKLLFCTLTCTSRHWRLADVCVKPWQGVRAKSRLSSRPYKRPGKEPAQCWRGDGTSPTQLFR